MDEKRRSSRVFRTYVSLMLAIGVLLLGAILVFLVYGGLKLSHAGNTLESKVNRFNSSINQINTTLKNIDNRLPSDSSVLP